MAYDEALAERVRAAIGGRERVTELRMFGGLAWMVAGNMACVATGEELAVRLDRADAERALAQPGVRPFDMAGRVSKTMVVVAGDVLAEDEELASWVDAGADHAASLAPK
jgi:TfoX/Sxy family transcriptional regulator of competence genes